MRKFITNIIANVITITIYALVLVVINQFLSFEHTVFVGIGWVLMLVSQVYLKLDE